MRRILASTILVSSLILPAAAFASTPVDDATAPTPIRVSTGVTEPVLVDSASLTLPAGYTVNDLPENAEVGLSLTIDEKGVPQNIQVTKSFTTFWDARVVEAVKQFRFKPGKVDNQPTAVDLNLTVNIAH